MNKYIIITVIILFFIYVYFFKSTLIHDIFDRFVGTNLNSNTQNVIHTVDRAQIAGTRTEHSSGILKKENNISVKEIISNDPLDIFENQINNSKSDIESSQIEINSYNQSENQFSDTTNRLISESYNDLITDIYKKALLLLSINNHII